MMSQSPKTELWRIDSGPPSKVRSLVGTVKVLSIDRYNDFPIQLLLLRSINDFCLDNNLVINLNLLSIHFAGN